MPKKNKQILHEIFKIEALLKAKRIQNAKRKKTKEKENEISSLHQNSDVFYALNDAVEDYKGLKNNMINYMINAVFSFLQPKLTYQYAKIRIKSEK